MGPVVGLLGPWRNGYAVGVPSVWDPLRNFVPSRGLPGGLFRRRIGFPPVDRRLDTGPHPVVVTNAAPDSYDGASRPDPGAPRSAFGAVELKDLTGGGSQNTANLVVEEQRNPRRIAPGRKRHCPLDRAARRTIIHFFQVRPGAPRTGPPKN